MTTQFFSGQTDRLAQSTGTGLVSEWAQVHCDIGNFLETGWRPRFDASENFDDHRSLWLVRACPSG